jgi:uncharacterized protein YggE
MKGVTMKTTEASDTIALGKISIRANVSVVFAL